jgi:hypothetical protein
VIAEILARLEALRITSVPTATGYVLFTRDNCAAFAHERPEGVSIGSSGLMTEDGLAFLVWREGQAYLAVHGGKQVPATSEQVEAIQHFSEDLKTVVAS